MANALQQALQRNYMQDMLDNRLERVRPTLGHLGMYLGLVAYTTVGAYIFQALEHPLEVQTLEEIQSLVLLERENFVRFIFNGSWNSVTHRDRIDQRLLDYEQTVAVAANEGIDMSLKEPVYQWSYIQAVFFSSTILTTIGYGNIAPVSTAGRVFCILFAIVGIPFTLSVIADVGQIFATLVSAVWKKYKHILKPLGKRLKLMASKTDDEDGDEGGSGGVGLQSNIITAVLALLFLALFLSIGSMIFTIWEDWTFFEAFYFCFITMTTIGFGDIVPKKTAYMLVCMIYILVGLAFTSTIIELVRRQYAESWRKMQEIRAQIQAQLKLAATLRQMAQNNIEVEGMDIAGDLATLKANIAKYKGRFGKGLGDFEINDLDWIDSGKKVKAVTIFIYESSV
ncbi:TWiK family of potassium channels protein 7-like isoform X2 [Tigriopus californicus]|uniref:TWiK family of potassium channels protein 7-like isoform X2 n=1 Tax=Tigriopus californicus TaxID=6832 RepID=UPI0027D9EDE9|nr:TWiK family of potassium channels protein 7-like isoform X2 [Tigriopus californicus]